jgi:hypothetical protein
LKKTTTTTNKSKVDVDPLLCFGDKMVSLSNVEYAYIEDGNVVVYGHTPKGSSVIKVAEGGPTAQEILQSVCSILNDFYRKRDRYQRKKHNNKTNEN